MTWFVNNGSTPDCKAFDEVIKFLGDDGIGVEGVILERGFASNDVINAMTACNLDYVVMLKGKFGGIRAMFEAHTDEMLSFQAGSRKNGSENLPPIRYDTHTVSRAPDF